MGTRSFITIKTKDGYAGIYCHWDGYLSHNGAILDKHYRDEEKIKMLLSLGDLSVLEAEIGTKHDFPENPEGECTFYGRDRGDKDRKATTRKTLKALINYAGRSGCEFFYLYRNGDWEYAKRGPQFFGGSDGSPFSPFRKLTDDL